MKRKKGLTLGIATGLLLTLSFANAKAGDTKDHTRPTKGKFAGTFLSTRMDLNDDGVLAAWSTAEVNGTLGKRTVQGIAETVPTGPTPECPGGVFIIDAPNAVGFSAITATFPNGDQT